MSKKLVAVTGIQHDGQLYEAGKPVDPAKFSKEQLRMLYDSGAVTIEEVTDEPEASTETTVVDNGETTKTPEDS